MTSLAKTEATATDTRVLVEDIFRLTSTQEGMLLHAVLGKSKGAHHTQLMCDLHGMLHVTALQHAYEDLSSATPALRTAFQWHGLEHPVQIVYRHLSAAFRYHDLSDRPQEEAERAAAILLEEDQHAEFELAQPPLTRITVIRLSAARHRLIWTHVDLLFDGWSLALLLDELFVRYAEITGLHSPTKILGGRPSYKSFISAALRSDQDDSRQFWAVELRGITTATPLPMALRTSAGPSTFGHEQLEISVHDTARLLSETRRIRVSLSTVIQAAWGILLCRFSGDPEAVFGMVVSGRNRDIPDIDRIVGVLINTVPVRLRPLRGCSIARWLQQIQRAQIERAQHEQLSLGQIQTAARWSGDSALFESIVIVENYPGGKRPRELAGLQVANIKNLERVPYPLTLFVTAGRQITIEASFDETRFQGKTVTFLLKALEAVVNFIVQEPNVLVDRALAFVPQADLDTLARWNATERPYDTNGTLHDLVDDQAKRTPQAIAVTDGQSQLSYADINSHSHQLAARLMKQCLPLQARVGVLAGRSSDLVIALLAVLKAGGAYVPLDPDYPDDRLEWMAKDAGIAVLLTTSDLSGRARSITAADISCIAIDIADRAVGIVGPLPHVHPDALAYVIYTSGSTGRPKGVMISHRSIRNRILWMQDAFQLTERDAVLQKTSVSFDVSVWEFFWTLSCGARLVIAPPGTHRDPAILSKLISLYAVTVVHFVPSMLRAFVSANVSFGSLQKVFASGEELPAALVRDFRRVSQAELHNLYGPTEAAVDVTWWPATVNDGLDRVSIGRPIANTTVQILDPDLNPVPVGAVGEICIGGVNVARGYLGRPGLTAELFCPDATSQVSGGRLYRTGDLGRFQSDGTIDFLGRRDQQVKVRGVRIELGEVEHVLRSHPGVRDAAVGTIYQEEAGSMLVAYVQAAYQLLPAELRKYLRGVLPEPMVPSRYILVEALPIGATGKVDRKALQALTVFGANHQAGAENLTASEAAIAQAWKSILGLSQVTRGDDFFHLGGHSLSAVRLVNRIRADLNVELDLRELFQARTLGAIAQLIDARRPNHLAGRREIVTPNANEHAPASSAQSALWFLWRLNSADTSAAIASAIRVTGRINRVAMQDALSQLALRHDMLRTTFREIEGHVVLHHERNCVPHITFDVLLDEDVDGRDLAANEARKPFNLRTGPLWRIRVVSRSESDHWIITVMHHAISDGWSMGLFIQDFVQCYNMVLDTTQVEVGSPQARYSEWARSESAERTSEKMASQLRSAVQSLVGMDDYLNLPRRKVPLKKGGAITLSGDLTSETICRLREFALNLKTTPFVVGLASWAGMLHRLTGQTGIPIGIPVANRLDERYSDVIGYFANLLIVPASIDPDGSFDALTRHTRDAVVNVLERSTVPFDLVVSQYNPRRIPGRMPIVRTAFAYEYVPASIPAPHGLSILTRYADAFPTVGASIFDLHLRIMDDGERVAVHLEYDSTLYDEVIASEIMAAYKIFLEAVLRAPSQGLSVVSSIAILE